MKIIIEADNIEQLVSIVGRISGDRCGATNHRVEDLPLSLRTRNCLIAAGITDLNGLLDVSERELLNLPSFGKKSADEVMAVTRTALLFRMQKQ